MSVHTRQPAMTGVALKALAARNPAQGREFTPLPTPGEVTCIPPPRGAMQ
jgi:hypothetical protein